MQIFLSYLYTFLVGGAICAIGQLLIIRTKLTPARILVIFLVAGSILEGVGLFKYIEEFAGSGVMVPILGFGALLTRGAIEGVKETGFLGLLTGPLTAVAGGLAVAIVSAFFMALIFKSRSKK